MELSIQEKYWAVYHGCRKVDVIKNAMQYNKEFLAECKNKMRDDGIDFNDVHVDVDEYVYCIFDRLGEIWARDLINEMYDQIKEEGEYYNG